MPHFLLTFLIAYVSFTQASVFRLQTDDNLVERSMEHDGLQRWFLEHRPSSYVSNNPVVILLHGGTSSMRQVFDNQHRGTRRWLALSDTHGFLLLAPNGVNLDTGDTYGDKQMWSELRAIDTYPTTYDDVGFLSKLVQWCITEAGVNPNRIYVTGGSNGGIMTYTLLIQAPQLFAAGAAFISNLPVATVPTPNQTTPIFIMNGDKDRLMPWNGGDVAIGGDHGQVRSAFDTRDYWLQINGVNAAAVAYSTLPNRNWFDRCRIQLEAYPANAANASSAPVHFYRMAGGGHSVPSPGGFFSLFTNLYDLLLAGPSCHDVEGADVAWSFLSQFSYYSDRRV